jgi:PAS domain S-box-containing protein
MLQTDLSAIIEASPLAIVSLDAQGCVSIWNRAAEAILGWKHEDARNQ